MASRLLVLVLVLALAASACGGGGEPAAPEGDDLAVSSTAFDDGGTIPPRYTCDAEDVQPPLAWDGVPDDAVEVAVFVEDPDAPGGTFTHWLAAEIRPGTNLTEGAAPPVEGTNDFGDAGYGGPCPPPGDEAHRYVFTVLAVDAPLDLAPGFTADDLRVAAEGAVVARGELVGTYGR